ncbi:protein-glucosylgalactosylhydroxylysine glucosidase-like [Hyposmocoma kahamanoa]|uniref:protein-glucosylgalactosylhydroxylysine glucosidase-like n=1 Tax=Hyposmocoma kahamanoa TaxID=1477025 RepID=UPI000E6D61E1|nr:protein-glucosylgalactosylhydroxylysine glucosidase-like [Hyposmocoma kahamanoa]
MLCLRVVVAIAVALVSTNYMVAKAQVDESVDVSEDARVFSTRNLPIDDRLMPSIGNGHIATNIFSDAVFMNGLYNGLKGDSHRARIPAYANIRLDSPLTRHLFRPLYSLDTSEGAFKVRVDSDKSVIVQRTYAHRYYTRAIVNQIQVTPKPHSDPQIWVPISLMQGPESNDITFEAPVFEIIENRESWSMCGETKESEDPVYQPAPEKICLYWTAVPNQLVVPQHSDTLFTFVMTADKKKDVARQEFVKVLQEEGDELYRKHVAEWQTTLQQAGIDIEGDLHLAKIVNGMWYYLLSSLPSQNSYHPPEPFYGLSPGGLARGAYLQDYQGHNFWDTETWMFPPILLYHPNYANKLLQYRLNTAPVAKDLSKARGYNGYRFAWESAFTGREVTPECCPEVVDFEEHISADIAFAARQYIATTRDENWLQNGGCDLVTNIADFWASKVVMNHDTGYYDIPNVMGPDEDHHNITNSVFTNVVAGFSLYLAQYASCLCKPYYEVKNPDNYANIAWSLALPYDEELDYHPQYQDYERGVIIKQADAILLGFPLQYPMKTSTRANDLAYYETVTRDNGPAMTWSMHTIGHLDLGENEQAALIFNRSYEPYVRQPFKMWTEARLPDIGAVNFLTGMGGFLQALTFGYAGVRIHLDRLEINKPQLPPGVSKFTVRGIKYLGAELTLDIDSEGTVMNVSKLDDQWPLTMTNGNDNVALKPNTKVTLQGSGPFVIRSVQWKNCELPVEMIGQNFRPLDTKF